MKKPIIGLIALVDEKRESYWMLPGYMEGIARSGGIAVMLPLTDRDEDIAQLTAHFDGFLFTGGHDVDPALYGQEKLDICGDLCPPRDKMEAKLLKAALAADKPVLGICRGLQLMNAVLGGTLYQDLVAEFGDKTNHRMAAPYGRAEHTVTFTQPLPGLEKTLGVNSCHHQGILDLAPGVEVWATAPDGLVEAIFVPGKCYARAVQWHPEFFAPGDPLSEAIFESLVAAAKENM